MAISAKDVMSLRQRTGLGMMECKKALEESNGDADAAVEALREKLKGKMDERTDRDAGEGLVALAEGDGSVCMIEVNCETDFVARNDDFVDTVQKIAEAALAGADGEVAADAGITEQIDALRISTKENVQFRRGVKLTGGLLGAYVHHNRRFGALVKGDGKIDAETLTGICQHVVSHQPPPVGVAEEDLPAEQRDAAMAEAKQEAIDSGKPEEIAEKIATGKYRKWVGEHTLLGQKYVKDPDGKQTVGDALGKNGKVECFVRFALGE
ncbi:MAG: translation elongation factor Ts [Planctomycetaceae bacterium]|nr:translation elongation factor Ts [Planctomycetaceae bacterium]